MIYPIHHSGKIQWPQDRNLGERMKLSRKLKSGGCSNYCDTFIVPLCLSNHGVNDFLKLFGLEGSRKTLTWILHSNILKILFSPSSASFMEKMSDDPDPVGPRIPGSKQQFLGHHWVSETWWNLWMSSVVFLWQWTFSLNGGFRWKKHLKVGNCPLPRLMTGG